MAELWKDGFDHYGSGSSGRTRMLQGPWAAIELGFNADSEPVTPSFGARTGSRCFRINSAREWARRVLGTTVATAIFSTGYYTPEIPNSDNEIVLVAFMSSGDTSQGTLFLQSDGSLTLRGPASPENNLDSGAFLGTTTGPVIQAGTWHHVEVEFTVDGSTGACEVRVDETVVMTLTNLNTGSSNLTQILIGSPVTAVGTPSYTYYDDMIARDTTGAVNNDFEGDLRVATLFPNADAVAQGWTPRPIQKLGDGVLRLVDEGDDKGLTAPDNAAFIIGSDDFCVEEFVRFTNIPATTDTAVLASHYRTDTDARSWRLFLNGPANGGTIVFAISTDGTLGTVTEIVAFPWTPIPNVWYHVAVSREAGVTRLWIDGQQYGIDHPDANTYFDSNTRLAVGSQAGSSGIVENISVDGYVDCFRLTVGAARYTAPFVPPTEPLPDNNVDDPLYDDVVALLNFDDGVVDQSVEANVWTLLEGATVVTPNDGSFAYQVIDDSTPDDNTYIEAALVPATGTLTLTANPLDTEQVVLGAVTYTFQAVLVDSADNVLIGATATDSLNNLIAAINQDAGEGTLYGTGTVQNADAMAVALPNDQMLATARTPGSGGNALASTTSVTGASWGATTLEGGADIPGVSEFIMERMPPETTSISTVSIVQRAFKSDAGSAELTSSFVTAAGSSDAGAGKTLSVNPTYKEDIFTRDPGTLGAITPATLVGAKIRVNRTV